MSSPAVVGVGYQDTFCGRLIYPYTMDVSTRSLAFFQSYASGVIAVQCQDGCKGEDWVRVSALPGKQLRIFSPWFLLFSAVRWGVNPRDDGPIVWDMQEMCDYAVQHVRWMQSALGPTERIRSADVASLGGAVAFLRILKYHPEFSALEEVLSPFCDIWRTRVEASYEYQEADHLLAKLTRQTNGHVASR